MNPLISTFLVLLLLCNSMTPSSDELEPQLFSKPSTISINVEIINIRNTNGRIQLQIYKDQTSFEKETPSKSLYISKKKMSGHTINYTLTGLSPGTYGLALLDDENNNTKLDYGLIMPKEGFGFSDYYHTSWSKPKFNDFKFYLKSDKTIKMRIRYL